VLARTYAIFPLEDLNPAGKVYYPDVVTWLVQRFQFLKYPTKLEDFDESKGIEFVGGKAGNVTVEKLVILNSGIYVDTLASTDASEAILKETLTAAAKELGIYYQEERMLKRRAYISQISFYSDAPLFLIHPVFSKIADVVSKEVNENFGQSLPYQATALGFSYDITTTRLGPAPFNIQRRENTPFADNKYFSVAPVRTKAHLKLLEMVEDAATGRASA